jgi:hypothetical protein
VKEAVSRGRYQAVEKNLHVLFEIRIVEAWAKADRGAQPGAVTSPFCARYSSVFFL